MADRNRDASASELLAALNRIQANVGRAEAVTKRAEGAAARAEGAASRVEGAARRVGEYVAPRGGAQRNVGGRPIFENEGATQSRAARFLGYPGGASARDQRRPIDVAGGSSTELARLNLLRQQGIKLTAEQIAEQLRYQAILRSQVDLYERLVALDNLRRLPRPGYIEGTARDVTPPPPPRQLPPGGFPPNQQQLGGFRPFGLLPGAGETGFGAQQPYAGQGRAVPNPARVRDYYQELQRAALIQADASQQMRRHGALTTEFLTALARGETTLAEFRYQMGATIGKFAGWTAAATAVYGVVAAVRTLGEGAVSGLSAVQDLSRFVTNGSFDRNQATTQLSGLSRKYNVSPEVAGEASIGVAKVYKDQNDALDATAVVLKAVQVAELEAADATKYFAAIGRGANLDIEQLALVLDQVNAAQNNIGTSSADAAAGLARATPAFVQAGGSVQTLVELMTTLQALTGESGTTIGTALARSVSRVRRPSNQQVLKEFGIDPNGGLDQIFAQAISKAPSLTGNERIRLGGQGLSSPEYGRFFTALLGNTDRYRQVQATVAPGAAKGSADRELEIRLDSIREKFKRLNVELQNIGLQLAQAGVFHFLGAGLEALTLTLQAINEVLALFNQLPGPVKLTGVALLELSAVLALIRRTGVGQALAERAGIASLGRSPEELARVQAVRTSRALSESFVGEREAVANRVRDSRLRAYNATLGAEALVKGGAPKAEVDEARNSAKRYAKAAEEAAKRETILAGAVKRQDDITRDLQKRRLTPAQAGIGYFPGGAAGSGQGPTTRVGGVRAATSGAYGALNRVAGSLPAISIAILGLGAVFTVGSRFLDSLKQAEARQDYLETPGTNLEQEQERQKRARRAVAEGRTPVQNPYTGKPQPGVFDESREAQLGAKAIADAAKRQADVTAARGRGLPARNAYLAEIIAQAQVDKREASNAQELKRKLDVRRQEIFNSIEAQKNTTKSREAVQHELAHLDTLYRTSLQAAQARSPLQVYRDATPQEFEQNTDLLQSRLAARPGRGGQNVIRGLAAAYLAAFERFSNSQDPEELKLVAEQREKLFEAISGVSDRLQTSLKSATNSGQRQVAFREALSALRDRRRTLERQADQSRRAFFNVGRRLAEAQQELDDLPRDTGSGLREGADAFASPFAGARDIRAALKRKVERLRRRRDAIIKRGSADAEALRDIEAELEAFERETQRARFQDFAADTQRRADLKKSTVTDEKANLRTDVGAQKRIYDEAVRRFGRNSDEAIDSLIKLNELNKQLADDVAKTAAEFAAKVQSIGDLRTSRINPNTAAGGLARVQSDLQTARNVVATLQEHGAEQEEINQAIAQVNDLQFQAVEAARQIAERLAQAKFRQRLAGILSPTRRARAQLRFDRSQLGGKTGVERQEQLATVREDEVALRQALLDEDLADVRFKHDIGRITDNAYIRELKKILRTRKLAKAERQAIKQEIYQLQQDADEATELELAPGGAHLPTLTEIRKFIGAGSLPGKAGSTTTSVVDARTTQQRNEFNFILTKGAEEEKVFEALEKAGIRGVKTKARQKRLG